MIKKLRTLASGLSLLFIAVVCDARAPATTQAIDEKQLLQNWWKDLEKPQPWSARALLDFSTRPDQTVAFLKENLKPLILDQKELDDGLHALCSEDEKIWKPAFEKLSYLDPRLNVDFDTLMEGQTDPVGRYHLAALLTDEKPDKFKDQEIAIRHEGGSVYFFITKQNSQSYYNVETDIAKLDTPTRKEKRKWLRADLAIVLLQHIGTPSAIEVLKNLATGNPNAEPTKIARLAVNSLPVPAK